MCSTSNPNELFTQKELQEKYIVWPITNREFNNYFPKLVNNDI